MSGTTIIAQISIPISFATAENEHYMKPVHDCTRFIYYIFPTGEKKTIDFNLHSKGIKI